MLVTPDDQVEPSGQQAVLYRVRSSRTVPFMSILVEEQYSEDEELLVDLLWHWLHLVFALCQNRDENGVLDVPYSVYCYCDVLLVEYCRPHDYLCQVWELSDVRNILCDGKHLVG